MKSRDSGKRRSASKVISEMKDAVLRLLGLFVYHTPNRWQYFLILKFKLPCKRSEAAAAADIFFIVQTVLSFRRNQQNLENSMFKM